MKKTGISILLISLLILGMAISGCIFPEEGKEEKLIKLELVGRSHKIFAGDSTTYIILVNNHREENDTITLSVASKPSEFDVTLNQTTIELPILASMGIFLRVNASQDASKGEYKVKIEAVSGKDGEKNALTIKTNIIEEGGESVKIGDKVEVDYLGYLDEYKVFDTSIEDVAKYGVIQKSIDFQPRDEYEPLKVYVGPNDPDTSDEYGSVVEGFWEAIVGMKVGQSRTVVLPPSKAYGEFVNATLNVTEEVPMLETMTLDEFKDNYVYLDPYEGMETEHYFWGWNISVDYVNEDEDIVRIQNAPYLSQNISPYGWESEVIYKNQSDNGGEGRILVRHDAQSGMQATYLGFDAEVISVENNQIKLIYNKSTNPLGRENLTFDITLIEIPD